MNSVIPRRSAQAWHHPAQAALALALARSAVLVRAAKGRPPPRLPKPDRRSPRRRDRPTRRCARRNGNDADDDDDDEDELKLDEDDDQERKLMLRLREQRMAEMRTKERRARFGRVFPISRVDYTREVTEAWKEDPDRPQGSDTGDRSDGAGSKSESKGTAVVCFLYKDGLELCKLLGGYLDTIASKNPATKFVSIVGDKCIPNYADRNLPTLLIAHLPRWRLASANRRPSSRDRTGRNEHEACRRRAPPHSSRCHRATEPKSSQQKRRTGCCRRRGG